MADYWDKYWQGRTTRRRFLGTAGAAGVGAAGLGLVGCGDDGTKGAIQSGSPTPASAGLPRRGGVWRSPIPSVVPNLDIHKTNAGAGLWDWVGNYLVRFDVKNPGSIEPDLAAALPETPDELTFVFKINPKAKWQQRAPVNGRAVNSRDVKFTFEDVMDPKTASPRRGNYASFVDSISAPDDATVIFHMKVPKPDLLPSMADQYDFIYPEEWKSARPPLITNSADVVGTGPYELTAFSGDQGYKLQRRADGYWKPDAAWLDSAEFPIVPDPGSQVAGLLAGQFTSITGQGFLKDRKDELKGRGISVYEAATPSRNLTIVNHKVAPFTDPRVRLALSRAINRKQVYDLALAGAGTVGAAISPSLPTWILPETEMTKLPGYLKNPDEDLAEAKKLMSAAGLEKGFDVTCETLSGSTILDVDTVLVPMYRKVGVNMALRDIGTGGAFAILQLYVPGNYAMGGFAPIAGPYPDAQLIIYHHSDRAIGTRNYSNYSNPKVDELLLKQSVMFDHKERLSVVQEIQRLVAQDPGPIWIGSYHVLIAHSPAVRGYRPTSYSSGYQVPDSVWLKA